MTLRFFLLHGKFVGKKFPRTPYETCKRGSTWLTLLKYENRSQKIVCRRFYRRPKKRAPKTSKVFQIVFWAAKKFVYNFFFLVLYWE